MSAPELYRELDTYSQALVHQVATGDAEVRLLQHATEANRQEMAAKVRSLTELAVQAGKLNMNFLQMQKQLQGMGGDGMNTGPLEKMNGRLREKILDICELCYPGQPTGL
ncbi:hypothetical protein [Salininema proteolyticum]|uniref:Coat F domain-containing protein n=1 Tax=Salininema proteolyticum TaxID=1607685 RepID=A0ABV8TZX5_9ACTN